MIAAGRRRLPFDHQLARPARATEVEHATVDLLLVPTDPPALRIVVRLEGA